PSRPSIRRPGDEALARPDAAPRLVSSPPPGHHPRADAAGPTRWHADSSTTRMGVLGASSWEAATIDSCRGAGQPGRCCCALGSAVMPLEAMRPYDPVVVQTGRLPRLPDCDPAHYRLYVMRGTWLVPIPFQVDARDGQGRYVFDPILDRVGAPLDDDDELAFMPE